MTTVDFTRPDSALCARATALVHALSPAFLAHHGLRSYAFACAIAAHRGLRPDRELLYVAAVLHDLGLTDVHRGTPPFELRGAAAARAWCVAQGVAAPRAELVYEAVALHASYEAATREPEIALVHMGTGVDVIGAYADGVSPALIEQVVARWPRLGFKTAFSELLQHELGGRSDSGLADAWKHGLRERICSAPFDE